jgi:hypothetical protein
MTTRFLLGWLVLFTSPLLVHGILPTGQLTVNPSNGPSYTLLASQASFGPLSPMNPTDPPRKLVLAPSSNPLLCQNVTTTSAGGIFSSLPFANSIVVVPRGECTYKSKALHAEQLGAVGVVLYNTLSSRYSINTTAHEGEKYPNYSTEDILFPQQYYDYDCTKGQAMIPTVDLKIHPLPYNAKHNDPLLSGSTPDNLCRLHSQSQGGDGDFASTCDSQKCLITAWDENTTNTQACCAWDLHLWMYADNAMKNVSISIPTIFLTMRQGDQLLASMRNSADDVAAVMASRWRPDYNLSSLVIWMLGVAVAAMAAYGSAGDCHSVLKKLRQRRANQNQTRGTNNSTNNRGAPMVTRSPMQEETLELEPIHAVGFVVMASSSLFILFYFKVRIVRFLFLCPFWSRF